MNDYYDAYNRWCNLMVGGMHIHIHIYIFFGGVGS